MQRNLQERIYARKGHNNYSELRGIWSEMEGRSESVKPTCSTDADTGKDVTTAVLQASRDSRLGATDQVGLYADQISE